LYDETKNKSQGSQVPEHSGRWGHLRMQSTHGNSFLGEALKSLFALA